MVLFRWRVTQVEAHAPCTVVGDLHGQYFDLMRIFEVAGDPPHTRFVFLGDYVDRGKFSCEVVLYLLALKLTFPGCVTLLRGNHESAAVSGHFGFKDECKAKYGLSLYYRFLLCFQCMPLACRVATPHGDVLCLHGGLSPEVRKHLGLRFSVFICIRDHVIRDYGLSSHC